MITQPEVLKELKLIAARYNLPYKVVLGIVETYFEQIAQGMASADRNIGNYPTLIIPYLGKFFVYKGKYKYITGTKDDEDYDETEEESEDS